MLWRESLERARVGLGRIGLYHIFPNSLRDPQKVADSHPLATGGENLASTLRDMIQRKKPLSEGIEWCLNLCGPRGPRHSGQPRRQFLCRGAKPTIEKAGTKGARGLTCPRESDGTIRLLTLLTALFQDPAPSLIGLEEPELAIHPGAMAVLSDTMTEAALRGQVLVATHNPDLIDRLPIGSIRAVTAEDGSTRVGRVTEHQLTSVTQNLFSAGELHSH